MPTSKILKGQEDRKGFPQSMVLEVYEEQGHACAGCGLPFPLELLARNHKNNKHEDNRKENCQLVCRICHYKKTNKGNFDELRKKQIEVRTQLFKAIEDIKTGKLSGPDLERVIDASREIQKLDRYVSEFPSELQAHADEKKMLEQYVEGFKSALQLLKVELPK